MKTEHLRKRIAQQASCLIQPKGFFVAWNGVPMLSYVGFPMALLSLKEQLNHQLLKLRTENPGSKWAGTTLGALLDNKVLSLAELKQLKEICSFFEPQFKEIPPILITELAYVLFENRSLEKLLLNVPLPLASNLDESNILATHLQETNAIHAQFDANNLKDYLPLVQRAGNRESHYRMPHVESTLVAWIEEPPMVQAFIQQVNQELPHTFAWFHPASRHITIRALVFD